MNLTWHDRSFPMSSSNWVSNMAVLWSALQAGLNTGHYFLYWTRMEEYMVDFNTNKMSLSQDFQLSLLFTCFFIPFHSGRRFHHSSWVSVSMSKFCFPFSLLGWLSKGSTWQWLLRCHFLPRVALPNRVPFSSS